MMKPGFTCCLEKKQHCGRRFLWLHILPQAMPGLGTQGAKVAGSTTLSSIPNPQSTEPKHKVHCLYVTGQTMTSTPWDKAQSKLGRTAVPASLGEVFLSESGCSR
jgi:hypothetical protein